MNIKTPRVRLFTVPDFKCIGFEHLWFQPHAKKGESLFVETFSDEWIYVPFVCHQSHGFWTGESLPNGLRRKIYQLVRQYRLNYGELYFQKDREWVFYGLCPKISDQYYDQGSLTKVVQQLLAFYL